MKAALAGLAVFVFPAIAWAGRAVSGAPAPAMDEPGLLVLAVGFVGTGLALLRRRRRWSDAGPDVERGERS